ncbi:alpha/beta hydrolase family protein [Thaumasiovibrio subtropicus]|uniref:alpha/beta hydrolase family protein n=1 Tax=Thaumasiovibrio subtropicus TaxID=1891207 RepID=UPI00131A9565|nr:dienelactone hydrolase family protein [Thaumasiovibrio subtropicus]
MKLKISIAAVMFAIVSILFLLPEPTPPAPSGKATVGVTQFELQNEERWIQVSTWYPVSQYDPEKVFAYRPSWVGKALAEQQNLPEALMGEMLHSYSHLDAEVMNGKHPVIIFNHGYATYPRLYMSMFEQLASEGFIVMAIGHPGDSLIIRNAAGEFFPHSEAAKLPAINADLINQLHSVSRTMAAQTDRQKWHQSMTDYKSSPLMAPGLTRYPHWIANNLLLLDSLAAIETGGIPGPLRGHLDLENIGTLGHSFGGAVAVNLALSQSQIKAGLNLDGPQINFSPQQTIDKPLCFFYGDQTEITYAAFPWLNDALWEEASVTKCSVTFEGAGHNNFSDLTYNPYVKYMGLTGNGDGNELGNQINQGIVAFFNQQLRQQHAWPPQGALMKISQTN